MAPLTKIIRQGTTQALRIPAAFRLPSKEVEIHSTPSGLMIIDPAKSRGIDKALRALREMQGARKPARRKAAGK
jgi:virulence-associated protein VagC